VAHVVGIIAGLLLIALILVDAFETIVQPRRVTRRVRPTRLFLFASWRLWTGAAERLPGHAQWESSTPRDRRLGVYGPLALLLLLGLWATALVVGFALVHWGLGSALTAVGTPGFRADLYFSGTTFFTLGLGDVVPASRTARLVTVAEAATGFSFLALIIGYLPTIYGAFSERETGILLLDARAGSPPSAAGLLQRFSPDVDPAEVNAFLREWERWTADLLGSHLSYPVLVFFRSQHERQSWLAALTVILDACSLLIVGVETATGSLPRRQARLTFAIARHAVGDLSQVTNSPPQSPGPDRLPPAALVHLRQSLADAGLVLRAGDAADRALADLRALYEPYVAAMAERLRLALPPWDPSAPEGDDWATTAWQTDPAVAVRAVGWDFARGNGHRDDRQDSGIG
jgi:hypothetical protein